MLPYRLHSRFMISSIIVKGFKYVIKFDEVLNSGTAPIVNIAIAIGASVKSE
ncbi:hypothetical protein LCGC14_2750190, partial [marine sediment metagenome]